VKSSSDPSHFQPILDELECLLQRERDALRILDQRTIEETTAIKLDLDAKLTRLASDSRPSAAERSQLARVQRAARINQLLLVHARSCVQGTIGLLRGDAYNTSNPRGQAAPSRPVAVNIRG
jgi:hypothetical protein